MSNPPKRNLARAIILGVGVALLVAGFLVSTTALALAPGLFLIVAGFTVPAFFQADSTVFSSTPERLPAQADRNQKLPKGESSERCRTTTTDHG